MNTQINTNNTEKGFSLLELLLVVAVGAVLLLAGLGTYRLVTQNNNINDAIRILNVLKQQTQRAYQGDGQYPGSSTAPEGLEETLIDLNAFPAGVLAGTTPRHPFGGVIEIDGRGETFTITLTNIDQSTCISIGQAFSTASDPDFVGLDIGSTDIGGTDGIVTIAELTATGACPTSPGRATMTWEFY